MTLTTHTHSAYPPSFRFVRPFGIMAPLYDPDPAPPAPSPAPAPTPAPDPKMLQISEEEFEQRIIGRVKQAEAGWKRSNTVSALTAEERVELETSRKDREEAKRKELESKGQYEAALKSQEESIRKPFEEEKKGLAGKIDGLTTRLRTEIVTNRLLAAAATGNAYNAQQVVALTERFVKLDDEFNATVVDDAGNQRFLAGKPMTAEQLVDEFLKANSHLVKAQTAGGGGATGGASKAGGDPSELQKLEAEVVELEKKYRMTRDINLQTEHRKKSQELKLLRAKTAA